MDLSALLAMVPAQYALYVAAVCGVCAVFCAFVKPPSNPALAKAYAVVNALGMNFRYATNANAAPAATPSETVPHA